MPHKAPSLPPVSLHRLKLRPLLIFERVFNSPSIASAARELNMSQSAVTKAIQELEASLDVPLFERSNRGTAPTCYGVLLGERVRTVISELRYLTDELNSFRSGESGHVIVGTLISASAQLLPKAILKLKKLVPDVLVTVREGPNEQLFHELANGELDIVVGRLPEANLPLMRRFPFSHTVLYPDEICVVAGRKHPLARRKGLGLPDLLGYPWILPLRESPARAMTEKLLQDTGLSMPRNITESLSLVTNIGLLQDSASILFMPLAAARHFQRLGLVAILNVGQLGKFGDVGYTVRADRLPTPATQRFMECLR
ncbi:LysR family transcriptional regulator [Pusillimonas noertemannii]|uniref:LysR family transcriptional regulator n=1 Tax=Pusillimonas noertemannii TaxID=305977 RepID=A0A2U1CI79_9BURK|nr:LysR family transcriptional regulator [Pusillimonas noertemannii]NYT70448.1 LysR family transcriptional regulator [Pusillimonas noertemannii]PVY60648.1 LysR family transcriptional regulator [Pusillimonas noertemannii]TFL08658.1 LysR family transcriptional regulator [Pusillimonas noertemannii]